MSAGKQQKKKQSKGSQGKSAAAEQQQQQEHQQPKEGVRESADSDEDMQPVKGLCNAFSMFVHASVHRGTILLTFHLIGCVISIL